MNIIPIIAVALGILWGLTLIGFMILIILYYPFSKNRTEWRKLCSWEEE